MRITISKLRYSAWFGFITHYCPGNAGKNDGKIVWCKDCSHFNGKKCTHENHPSNRTDGIMYARMAQRR